MFLRCIREVTKVSLSVLWFENLGLWCGARLPKDVSSAARRCELREVFCVAVKNSSQRRTRVSRPVGLSFRSAPLGLRLTYGKTTGILAWQTRHRDRNGLAALPAGSGGKAV